MKLLAKLLIILLTGAGMIAMSVPASAQSGFRMSTTRSGGYCLTRDNPYAYAGQEVFIQRCGAIQGFSDQWDANVVRYPYGSGVSRSWLSHHEYWTQWLIHPIGFPHLYLGAYGIAATPVVWVWEPGSNAFYFVISSDGRDTGDGSYPYVLSTARVSLAPTQIGPPDAGLYQFWYQS